MVDSADELPQIFVKEASVILKSAIFEEPFKPQMRAASELVKGIGPREFPQLLGYVCATPKGRAEVPLVTQKGDPLLAHWQYGLGRTVAFTSDARAKWAANWLGWEKFQQFWLQVAQWSLRRVEASDFNTEVAVEKGEGHISVEAIDREGQLPEFSQPANAGDESERRKAGPGPATNRPRPLRGRLSHQGSRRRI